jgi:hypothetical protein
MKETTDIGNLINERLRSFEDNDISQDWDEMQLKLHKLKFYKFSFTNFNIYYCSFILISFALASSIFVKSFLWDNSIQQEINSSAINNPSGKEANETKIDSLRNIEEDVYLKKNNISGGNTMTDDHTSNVVRIESSNKGVTSSIKNTNDKITGSQDQMNVLHSNNPSTINSSDDHSHITNKTSGNLVSDDKISESNPSTNTGITNIVNDNLNIPAIKKNIVYITQQDTVEVFDTLRVKKPYKRKQ